MKEQYDFGEKKPEVKKEVVKESEVVVKEQYDFVTEAPNVWAQVARAGTSIANTNTITNTLRGAGGGAVIGAGAGMVSNALKRDDDPTKKGIIGSAWSGAKKGAAYGGIAGGAAHLATKTNLVRQGIAKAGKNATTGLKGDQLQKTVDYMNGGKHGITHRQIGFGEDGVLRQSKDNPLLHKMSRSSHYDKGLAYDFYNI